MCRTEPKRLSEVQKLWLAIEFAEHMRLAEQKSSAEAVAIAKLRKSIDSAHAKP